MNGHKVVEIMNMSTIKCFLLQECSFIFILEYELSLQLPLCFGNETIYISTSPAAPKQIHCLTVIDDRDKAGIRTLYCNMVLHVRV